ncbi:MAG: tyrosine-type recombinase/integrase [Pseudomonadota bacterium]
MARKPKYPGYQSGTMPSGNIRHRVRPEGNPKKWITIYAAPGEPGFAEQYFTARMGQKVERPKEATVPTHSVAWLVNRYETFLEAQNVNGAMEAGTLKKAKLYLGRVRQNLGTRPMLLEKKLLIQARNAMADRPAAADDTVTRVGQMYDWAIECGLLPENTINPATNISKIDKGNGGAVPWSPEDVKKFCDTHPPGSTPRLMLTLHVFTGCRIGDAVWLGADQEKPVEVPEPGWALVWHTQKVKGVQCTVPMSPSLYEATRPFAVPGRPYITKQNGEPYASADSLGQMFAKWCRRAGLENRSSHGVRKMVASLIAARGADPHAIAALLGHSSTKTTEVYTREFNRQIAAASAIAKLSVDV